MRCVVIAGVSIVRRKSTRHRKKLDARLRQSLIQISTNSHVETFQCVSRISVGANGVNLWKMREISDSFVCDIVTSSVYPSHVNARSLNSESCMYIRHRTERRLILESQQVPDVFVVSLLRSVFYEITTGPPDNAVCLLSRAAATDAGSCPEPVPEPEADHYWAGI